MCVKETQNEEVVPPRKKSRSSVKRTPSNTIRRKCMFRMKGTVEFTEDDKVVVTPDVTCLLQDCKRKKVVYSWKCDL